MRTESAFETIARAERAPRQLSARSVGFLRFATGITLAALLASFALSFHAVLAVAALLGLPPLMQPLMPAAVDVYILVSVCALAIAKEREGVTQPTVNPVTGAVRKARLSSSQRMQWTLIWLWTAASSILNGWNAVLVSAHRPLAVQIALAAVAVIFPAGVLSASETLIKLLVKESTDTPEMAAAKTRAINAGALQSTAHGTVPRKGTPARADLVQTVKSFELANRPISKAEVDRTFGVPDTFVFEALNSPAV